MKGSNVNDISLTSYDEIFRTDEVRDSEILEKIKEIPLAELHSFQNHPFKVRDDAEMQDTAESIAKYGVLTPCIARVRADGGYELIAGHRRKRACEIAGLETMPVIVWDLDDDEATIIMVDSNLQRETVLFSERAFAYKMKLEAIKRRAGRPLKNSTQVGQDFKNKLSVEIIAEQSGESRNQIQRYIRLTELIKELLDMADSRKIAFNPAVELSYLTNEEQTILLDIMAKEEAVPSLAQAHRMKKHSQSGTLTEEIIDEIMCDRKPEIMKVTFTSERLKKYFPGFATPQEMEETIIKLLESWLISKNKK
jgi:ParB family chromosome partitioning protein